MRGWKNHVRTVDTNRPLVGVYPLQGCSTRIVQTTREGGGSFPWIKDL